MRERPRLVVSRKPTERVASPWQTESPPWLDNLRRKQKRKRWQYRATLGLGLLVVSATVFIGVSSPRFNVGALNQEALSFAKSLIIRNSLYVVDGDTIHYNGEKIRIANIDTPEIGGAKCESELRRGLDAKAALKALLDGESLEVRRGDPKTGRTIDKYGRTLALVSIRGRDVGTILIQQRHARPWVGRRMPWC
jgi:micrococcal nuclease